MSPAIPNSLTKNLILNLSFVLTFAFVSTDQLALFTITLFNRVENFFQRFKVEFCVVVGVEKTVYFLLNVG